MAFQNQRKFRRRRLPGLRLTGAADVVAVKAPSGVVNLTCPKAAAAARDREKLLNAEPFSVRQA